MLSRTQAFALRYAEALLEDPDFLGIDEMFSDENITEEEHREVWNLMSKITLCYPQEWDK